MSRLVGEEEEEEACTVIVRGAADGFLWRQRAEVKQTSLERCDLLCFPRVVNHRLATIPLPPDLRLPQRISPPGFGSLYEALSTIMT